MADTKRVGVGGWLALFAFGIGAMAPLRIVGDLAEMMRVDDGTAAARFGSLWTFVLAAEWAIGLLTVAFCWFMVWRLLKVERWSTVRIVIVGVWIIGPGRNLAEMLLWGLMLDASAVVDELGPPAGAGLVSATFWTAYFLRSRRVANTYGREPSPAMVGIFS